MHACQASSVYAYICFVTFYCGSFNLCFICNYLFTYLHLFVILLANCYLFSLGVVGTVNFLAIFTVVWFIVLHVLCSPMPIVY